MIPSLGLPFFSRFECKYLVSEAMAQELRQRLRYFMVLDSFCAKSEDFSYLNTSLYFDSPDYQCREATDQGAKNRFKIRLRWYDDAPGTPLYLEEKRRTTDAISKSRVKMHHEALASLTAGRMPRASMVLDESQEALAEARRLSDKMLAMRARPACYVRYRREAWAGKESAKYVRATFDRALEGHAPLDAHGRFSFARATDPGWIPSGERRVIFEVKFESAMPPWLQNTVRDFALRRVSVPKYLLCLDAIESAPRRL